eukprot:TRINITY_DN136_c0_g1_i2.p2 TRINITY_DN136_c0_g1~~TRINITY_DN136_c0_g1_i2.p2  ORF type:complete len:1025 (-),score=93.25 TRINITY_DN136_c0_g1_i2:2722-5796(-)
MFPVCARIISIQILLAPTFQNLMKPHTERHKATVVTKKLKATPVKKCKDDAHVAAPLTTADLAISTFHFFSEKIEFKTTFRPELWPKRKIVGFLVKQPSFQGHTFELSVNNFLPSVEIPSHVLAKLWNVCAVSESKESVHKGTLKGSFECHDGHRGCVKLNETGSGGTIDAQFHVKSQKGPNSFQTASALQISKAELQSMCDTLKGAICRHKRGKITSREEAEDISKCISGGKIEERVADPLVTDFLKIQCILATDQITHKLLCKVLTLVPDIAITLRPIKGFAVVTTPMSIKLLQKTGEAGYGGFQTGFLTLDQESRIVPLHASDPKVKVYTIVGIWVSGLSVDLPKTEDSGKKCNSREENLKRLAQKEDQKAKCLNNHLVLAAILRFLFTDEIKSRMSPKPKENMTPSYLLVNFVGKLPQFLEFRLKDRDNSWMLLDSPHNIPREPKNTFKPIKFKLNCGKEEGCTAYKFSYIISLHQETRPRSQCQKSRTNQENIDPNQSRKNLKSRNLSLKQPLRTNHEETGKKIKVVTQPKIAFVSEHPVKPLRISTEHSSQVPLKKPVVGNVEIRQSESAKGPVKLLRSNTESIKPVIDSTKGAIRIMKTFAENPTKPEVTLKEGTKVIKAPLNLLQSKTADTETSSSPRLDEENIDEGDKAPVYFTKLKSPCKAALPQNEVITPSQNGSLNSSLNSNGIFSSMQSSKLTGRIRHRLDQSGWTDQFPSYSGNVSLVRTPEYSAIASASKASPILGRIVVEQQKQIQSLQQQLAYLVETIRQMPQNGTLNPQVLNKVCLSTGNTLNSLNGSTEVNLSHGKTVMGVYPTLDLSRGESISEINNSFHNAAKMIEKEAEKMPEEKKEPEISPPKRVKLKPKDSKTTILLNKNAIKIAGRNLTDAQKVVSNIQNASVSDFSSRIVVHKNSVSKAVKPVVSKAEDYDLPKIIDPTASQSNNTVGPVESQNEALSMIKETNESVNTPKENAKKIVVKAKEEPKKRGVISITDSDWTMDIPKVDYCPELSDSPDCQ